MLKVINEIETNSFVSTTKSNNGGGYHQPLYTFIYKGCEGVFHDTSCGDFGERYRVSWNGRSFTLDEVSSQHHYSSNFTKSDSEFIELFKSEFGIQILTAEDVSI